jgi:hypothetical protein
MRTLASEMPVELKKANRADSETKRTLRKTLLLLHLPAQTKSKMQKKISSCKIK